MAWEKAIQIRDRILAGESFEPVARATSDDPSAKINSGNLGYFTVFQMTYPFENEVYSAEKGKLSMPVRTRFGYHIIRVNDRLKSRGEIKTAHIMIGFNRYGEQEAKEKAEEIHKNLLAGHDFELTAREYSTDLNTAGQGGVLPWFGSGRLVPEFESAAFALKDMGTISGPVRTSYGWHIIKLLDHRDIPPFDEIRKELTERVRESRDERYQLVRDALVERLRKEWEFTENKEALWNFHDMIDNRIFQGNWTIPAGWRLDRVLFTVRGGKITQRDFANFIAENAHRINPWPLDEYILSLYDEFVARWLISHEDKHLENKYPEFRFLMQEYEDGMLLFEITEREVWSRAQEDSTGLAGFHMKNRNDYMWDTRILASIFTSDDNNIATRGARRALRSRWFGRDIKWITEPLNRGAEEELITVERGVFSRGDDPLTDRIGWVECVSDVFQYNEQYRFVIIHEVLKPEPKSLEEARVQVLIDYLDYLEDEWIKVLRNKYNVEINKAVLSAIK
jgi:peptidyl-prolyl cis-trans isomerase SurA